VEPEEKAIARQLLCKHVPASVDMHNNRGIVFSVLSVLKLYNKDQLDQHIFGFWSHRTWNQEWLCRMVRELHDSQSCETEEYVHESNRAKPRMTVLVETSSSLPNPT
jgi:hypothetical protein